MLRIVSLKRVEAVEAIKHCKSVFYRRGVWNKYQKVDTLTAIRGIGNSGYGADVFKDEKMDDCYVSAPCDSDMWRTKNTELSVTRAERVKNVRGQESYN